MKASQDDPRLPPRERLRAYRKRNGLTVEALSELLGCSRSFLWAIFSGERKPGLEIAFQIERLTGIDARDWVDHAA